MPTRIPRQDSRASLEPDDSDLTIRITPFQAAKDGVPAPMEVMENAYIRTIPASAKLRDVNLHVPDGFAVKMYENTVTEEDKTVYVIYAGYCLAGELLSVSIWATDKTECEQTLDILKTIKKVI